MVEQLVCDNVLVKEQENQEEWVVHYSHLVSHDYPHHLWEQPAKDIEVDIEKEEAAAAEVNQNSTASEEQETIAPESESQAKKAESESRMNSEDIWTDVHPDYAERIRRVRSQRVATTEEELQRDLTSDQHVDRKRNIEQFASCHEASSEALARAV